MISSWQDQRRQVSLQNAVDQLGTRIQQLYFHVDLEDVSPGIVTARPRLPLTIDGSPFTGSGSIIIPSNPDLGRKLLLSLTIGEKKNTATCTVTFGSNVEWKESVFRSDSLDASINIQKFANGTLLFFFG